MSRLTLTLTLALVVANVCGTLSAPVTYDQQQTGDLNVQVHLKDIQIVALLDSSYLGDYGDYDYAYDYSDFTIKPITPARPSSSTASTTSVEPWHSWPTISGPASSSTVPNIVEAQNATVADPVTVKSSTQSSIATENENETETKPGDKESETKVSVPSESTTVAASSSAGTPEVPLKPKATIPESESVTGDTDEKDEKVEKDEIGASPVSDKLQESVSSTEANPSSVESGLPETTQATIDQPEAQQTRKCTTGYTRDQKGRCRRTHIRRRVPSSLLPFGIRLAPRVHRHRDQHSKTDSATIPTAAVDIE